MTLPSDTNSGMPVSFKASPETHVSEMRMHESTLILMLCGEINQAAIDCVQEFILAQYRRLRPRALTLDLRSVTFLDSQGLCMVMALDQVFQADGVTLRLTNANIEIRHLLHLTRLERFLA